MAGNYSPDKIVVEGEGILADDWNAAQQNHIDNHIPEKMDDYSATVAQMQSVVDPYPADSESQATSVAGEIARIRYQLLQILQVFDTTIDQWYKDAPTGILHLKAGKAGFGTTTPDGNGIREP